MIAFALIEGNPLGWTSLPVLAGFALSASALLAAAVLALALLPPGAAAPSRFA